MFFINDDNKAYQSAVVVFKVETGLIVKETVENNLNKFKGRRTRQER